MQIENIDKLVVYTLNGKNYIGFASKDDAKVSLALGYQFQNIVPLQKAMQNAVSDAVKEKNELIGKLEAVIGEFKRNNIII